MAALTLHEPEAALLAMRLRDLAWSAIGAIRTIIAGPVPIALREALRPGEATESARRATPVIRAVLLAGALVLVFGSLLRSGDPIFASLVSLPVWDIGELLSHVVLSGFFTWLVAGWARAALDVRAPGTIPPLPSVTLGSLELTTALGALVALFATYVLAQLGWFFGGEQFLRERTGLTAATYAREGFFQMVAVVLLVVPLLLATRAMLGGDRGLARRHTALAVPLLVLLGAMIVSAAARMRLYVHYYGLTTERFYPMVLMGWLALVLAWLALTVLRGRGERFVAGAVLSGLATLLVVDVTSPDALVARVNITRAASAPADSSRELDLAHLARLGGEALPLVVSAVIAPPGTTAAQPAGPATSRCRAATTLLKRWGPDSGRADRAREPGAWRTWNAGEARGLAVVAQNFTRLRAVRHESCVPSPAAGASTVSTGSP